jgi:hypothetical protein
MPARSQSLFNHEAHVAVIGLVFVDVNQGLSQKWTILLGEALLVLGVVAANMLGRRHLLAHLTKGP